MRIPIYQVDAFTSRLFRGNPAAVCPLDHWLPSETLQAIAAENNLAETAYLVKETDGLRIRWFTPALEVDLCGHATLASALVHFERLNGTGDVVDFLSRGGRLSVGRNSGRYTLDFPSLRPEPLPANELLTTGLGAAPAEFFGARDYMAVYSTAAEVAALAPDFAVLRGLDRFAIIATAPGDDCDFVSRFFAPAKGVDEDPVTGSAHCTLTPFWAKRLGKKRMLARQISRRGGELEVEDAGDRTYITGEGVLYLEGLIHVD